MKKTTVRKEHRRIADEARLLAMDIANGDPRIDNQFIGDGLFRISNNDDGLSLTVSQGAWSTEQAEALQEIGEQALQQAVMEDLALVVGLVVGEARAGRNYFTTYFPEVNQ